MTAREFILSRFRGERFRKAGGVSTKVIYGGVHSFALAVLDAELAAMRSEGVLGFANGLWFLRGGAPLVPKGPIRLKGPVDRRSDAKQRGLFDD